MRKALVECKILSTIARKSGGVVWTVWWLGAVTREEVQGGIPAYDSAPPRPRTTPAQQRAGNRENMMTMAVLESRVLGKFPVTEWWPPKQCDIHAALLQGRRWHLHSAGLQ